MELTNKTVVLTGAASGIGRALAVQLAANGCTLALVDRDEQGLQETVQQLPERHGGVTTHICDLADRDAVKALPAEILHHHPTVELLINNAGVAVGGTFEQVTEHDFDWLMQINFTAVVDLTRAFLPALRASGGSAKIVNVSSLFGLVAPAGQAAYCASKFAVRGFSNALRHELAGSNVSVLVVHPGGIATSIAQNARVPANVDSAEVNKQRKQMNKMLVMPPAKAAGIIIDAMQRDKARVLVGTDAKILALLERLLPVRYWPVMQRLMGKRSQA